MAQESIELNNNLYIHNSSPTGFFLIYITHNTSTMLKQSLLLMLLVSLLSTQSHAQGPEYTKWADKADELYKAKKYQESGMAFNKAFASIGGKAVPEHRYNAACSWALAGYSDSAFFHLNSLATRAKFTDYQGLTSDADFKRLHSDKRWAALCEQVKQNKEKAEANLDKSLVAMLDTMYRDDQQYREQIGEIQSKYGADSKQSRDLWTTIKEHDSVNVIKLLPIR